MRLTYFTTYLSHVACALTLSGCVAAPVAQLAVSQMAQAKPACDAASGCRIKLTSSSLENLSKGISSSFRTLTSAAVDDQTSGTVTPAR